MLRKIDKILNSITMYRLVLYYLVFLLVVAFILSFFKLLPFSPVALIISTLVLLIVSYLTNIFFSKVFKVETNVESVFITALILALIITPTNLGFLCIAAFLAQASKYILAVKMKHIFNPVAIALVITAFTIHGYASWWIGTTVMFPFTVLGFLIVRKIRRFDLVFYFFVSTLVVTIVQSFTRGNINILQIFKTTFLDSPILFFAFVMLTEPLTSPPTKQLQSIYGALTGLFFAPLHLGALFTTPEIALSVGNIFSYLVSPKEKLILSLKSKIKLTPNIYDFIFTPSIKPDFKAGQYMEWTLGHKNPDERGNRRYFTIASSPTENNLRIGVKFNSGKGSSFKKEMLSMQKGNTITASSLAGDFTLPKDKNKKLAFIAGGIGITPFRSMIKYCEALNEKRDIILIYSEKNLNEMVYKDIFTKSKLKVIYFETQKRGHITSKVIREEIPDFTKRTFYISGPQGLVESTKDILSSLKIPQSQIKLDYFSGF